MDFVLKMLTTWEETSTNKARISGGHNVGHEMESFRGGLLGPSEGKASWEF